MCLNYRKIKTRSKKIGRNLGQPVYQFVKCGCCAECDNERKSAYYLRSYYHALDCFRNGGYILFDTLTYNDDNLPSVNQHLRDYNIDFQYDYDFACFDRNHFHRFKEDLRQFVIRKYGKENGSSKAVQIYCVGEYGDRFGRPHYHLLLYVFNPVIDPVWLSQTVDYCWKYGVTDGIPSPDIKKPGDFRSESAQRTYVLNDRVFTAGGLSDLHLSNICKYLGKYLVKDVETRESLNSRLHVLRKAMHLDYDTTEEIDEEVHLLYTRVKNDMVFTPRTPQGFGQYMIECEKLGGLDSDDMIQVADYDGCIQNVPVPAYIKNKLYKERVYDEYDRSYYYRLSEYGKIHRWHRFEKDLDRLALEYDTVLSEPYMVSCGIPESSMRFVLDTVDRCMPGVSFRDLAFYNKCIRFRYYDSGLELDWASAFFTDYREFYQQAEDSIPTDEFFRNYDYYRRHVFIDDELEYVLYCYNIVKRYNAIDKQGSYDVRAAIEKRYKKLGLLK